MMVEVVTLKDGDCPDCEGCGYVADDTDGTPWRAWLALPLNASATVLAGLVKPEKCTLCGGTGEVPKRKETAPPAIEKAVVAFDCAVVEHAVIWATVGMLRDFVLNDGDRDTFHHCAELSPDDITGEGVATGRGSGIWVWEGLAPGIYPWSDMAADDSGRWRLPTDDEWAAIRENRNPFGEQKDVGPGETFETLTDEVKAKDRWWVSWHGKPGTFDLHLPWWVSGEHGMGAGIVFCAAVLADSEEEARAVVAGTHDLKGLGYFDWQFAKLRSRDWQPFCDRFPRADWMQWPAEYER